MWLLFFGGIVVSGVYETFDAWSYTKVGLFLVLTPILVPLLFPSVSGEAGIPWYDRFTTKANAFIFIFSWIGNYFWTHYFYKVLGTDYTFPAHRLNDVPIACTFITHSYFHLYHGIAAIGIRALWHKIAHKSQTAQFLIMALTMVAAGYFTAFMEVATISSFPYYTYKDAWAMWVIGSGFYGMYFLLSFPWFTRIDEEVDTYDKKTDKVIPAKRWSLGEVVKDCLAQSMFATILLDTWRITVGQIHTEGVDKGVSWIF